MKASVRSGSGSGLYGRRRRREMLISSRSVSRPPREGATGGGGSDPEVASRSLSRPPREGGGGGDGDQGITALLRRRRRLDRIKGEGRRGESVVRGGQEAAACRMVA